MPTDASQRSDATFNLPLFSRGAEVRAQSFNEDAYTIDVVFTTGARARRNSWVDGAYDEELVVTPESVRLDRLNAGAPFLNTHGARSLADVLGTVVGGTGRIESGSGLATIQLSRRPDIAGIVQDIRDGVISNVSVGYRLHRVIKIEGEGAEPPLWRVVDWEPYEISAVPMPIDVGAGVRSTQGAETFSCIVELATRAAPPSATRTEPAASPASPGEPTMPVATDPTAGDANRGASAQTTPPPAVTTPAPVAPAAPDAAAIRAEALREERARVEAIRTLGESRDGAHRAFAAEHINSGTALDAFRTAFLDRLVLEGDQVPTRSQVIVTQDETVTRRAAMEDYLIARGSNGQMTDAAREYRGSTLLDLCRTVLEWQRISARGLTPDEIAQRALHTTSDFPAILAAVVNKVLRGTYAAAPQTFRPFTRNMSLSDFKQTHIIRRGLTPGLAKLNEHGEYKRGTIAESDETIQLDSYGVMVGITRKTIINDDMGALTSIPADFAQSAATLESDLVWGIILANPTLKTDATALFHAAKHGNLAASGTALSSDAISAGRTAMSKQKDLDGKTVLNIRPSFLLVPSELESTAEKILATFIAAKAADVTPESVRSIKPIAEPRLSTGVSNADIGVNAAGSATAWYLASSHVDTVVTATLDGQAGPYIETQNGFDTDGVQIKCRHDFAAAAGDFRGLYKDPGAAQPA